ncbi:MAG: hypothetical protein NTW84_04220 [Methanothrix sp.]|nr:hypothetical protein [Methanothrix sp.]
MRKGAVRFICILAALMTMMLPAMCQTDLNATSKIHVLRLGLENVKPINSLDAMAPKSINNIGSLSMGLIPSFLKQKPVYDISGYPSIKAPNSIP